MSSSQANNDRAVLFRDSNFRWLISGGALSMLGDQFTLIALPWLVLKLTGDTLALGIVLAVMSVPRAIFILLGGALVDRYSPKRVLMLTKYVNTLLLGVLAALVLTGSLTMWMVYALAFGIGLSTAFSIPSSTAMMPHAVKPQFLQPANSMMLGLRQLSMFIGPLLAGVLIAVFGDGTPGNLSDAKGLGVAFLLDACSFAISAWTLAKVVVHISAAPAPSAGKQHVFKEIAEGLRYFWRDRDLRICLLYMAAVAMFIIGPIQIALPVLASSKLDHGAAALGILMGAHGAGTLLGMIVSGIKPNLRAGTLGMTILLIDGLVGILFMPMGLVTASWQGASLLLVIGALGGFIQIAVFTWIQRRVPPAMLGRAMSVFMFIFMGLAPISAAITGWIMRSITLVQLFASCGALLVTIVLIAFVTPWMRAISDVNVRPAPGI